ncbi:unnamed protein product [Withania somnifera]
MVRLCNASFIALISKKKGVEELRDYRPISLIGSVYKLLVKVLAERMKKVMASLVFGQQSAFLKNRQIIDATIIANEAGILFKMDMEKAFDQLNWAYLVNILKQIDFGERWIYFCISTGKFSVLINRSPVGFFSIQKGLKQGGPLFPFLFILAIEGLSQLLSKTKELQWVQEFQVGNNPSTTVNVSHLLYADYTLIFCGADRQQVSNLNTTLIIF